MIRDIIQNIEQEVEIKGNEKKIIQMIRRMITLRCNYDGLDFALQYIEKLYRTLGEECEAKRVYNTLKQVCFDQDIGVAESIDKIAALTKESFEQHGKEWADNYYRINEDILYLMIQAVRKDFKWRDEIEFINNIGWVWENLTERESDVYIFIVSQTIRSQEKELVIQLLKILHKKIFVLITDDKTDSIESGVCNIRQEEDISYVYYREVEVYDTIEYICSCMIPEKLATVIATGEILTSLSFIKQRKIKIERLSSYCSEQFEGTITFGWAGDYRSYLSTIMKEDVREELNQKSECAFSILIPVRNNVNTLKYTIMTCLAQEYKGNYEIVISDNSSQDNFEIKHFCDDLQKKNDKIKYYRTPREFCANKSYEFAVLKTRGEFVIIIGADDGICPWGLEVLSEVLQNTDADIIKWDMGQYVWPGYGDGRDDMLYMPGGYQKGNYNLHEIPKTDFWSQLLLNYKMMYELPNLYLNSGFRRRYLNKLYDKTGRIWDGRINDISLGVINICVNDAIMYLPYPITVAGNSKYSIGRAAQRAQMGFDDFRGSLKGRGSIGYVAGTIESKFDPDIQKECGTFYACLFYEFRKGVIPEAYVKSLFDWKKIVWEIYMGMQPDDMYYERDIHQLYSFTKLLGGDIGTWFEQVIYVQAFKRKVEENKTVDEGNKKYREWADERGAYCLDASKYGVKNIYEAVKLCKVASEL